VEATTVNREMRIGKLGIGNPGDRKFDISPGGLSGGGVILAKPDRVRRQHDADAPADHRDAGRPDATRDRAELCAGRVERDDPAPANK